MAKQTERATIFEKVGEVFCTPPSLEYKKPNCLERASYVCHHCNAPLCANCVVLIPDGQFQAFQEISSTSPLLFYFSIILKATVAVLLFPAVYIFSLFFSIPNIPSKFIMIDYYSLTLKIPLSSPLNISFNFVVLISVALILSVIKDIFCIPFKIEEKPDGRKELKKYMRGNLTAAHCQYCFEKYHKKTALKALGSIILLVIGISVLLFVVIGYYAGLIDLTVPLMLLMIAALTQTIFKMFQPVKIVPVTQ